MKCLEKDRTRRYDSASALAADIANHLQDEPVVASPASAAYRVRKFAKRHRLEISVAAMIVVALGVGLVIALSALQKEKIARRDAEAAHERERVARAAEDEARAYEKETDRFLINMFDAIDPAQSRGKEVTVRQILEQASKRLDQDPPKHTLAEASLRFTFGTAFKRLGIYDRARHELERALALEIKARGEQDRVVAVVTNDLASLYEQMGEVALAEHTFRRSLEIHRSALGPDARETNNAQANLGAFLMNVNKLDEADALMSAAVEYDRKHGTKGDDAAILKNMLGNLKLNRGLYAEAEALLRDALQAFAAVNGPDHPGSLTIKHGLADALRHLGRLDEAIAIGESLLADAQRVLGPTHPTTLRFAAAHALRLQMVGRLDESAKLFAETIAALKSAHGDDHLRTLRARASAVQVLIARQQYDAALTELNDVAARTRALTPVDQVMLLETESQIARTLMRVGRLGEAESMLRDLVNRARSVFGEAHPTTKLLATKLDECIASQKASTTQSAPATTRAS